MRREAAPSRDLLLPHMAGTLVQRELSNRGRAPPFEPPPTTAHTSCSHLSLHTLHTLSSQVAFCLAFSVLTLLLAWSSPTTLPPHI